ncbi:Ig-like domain-containing protein [Pseudobutyrivibrio ruminis]|uniref:Ig-like domain-containing protein n=1 Tax=Pseudobutyrivibrio ruminis TaxID=46206 RepID=UPI00068CF989|nr:Ig domain-containing protein [Pseudobutyrivibrio ruminis]
MRLKKKILGIIVCFALVLSLMPGMGMTAHADNTETLLTTIIAKNTTTYDETEAGVVIVSHNNDDYTDGLGWLWNAAAGTLKVTGREGYTFTKVIFKQASRSVAVASEPFELHFVEDTYHGKYMCEENNDMNGVTSIEVYGYATQTTVAVTDVSLNKNSTALTVGDTETLTATVSPDGASNKSVTWSSDNTSVATVDANGKVTAVSSGTANITATTTDGSKTATCAVTVNATSSGGDSSDSGNSGSSESGSTSGGSTDSGSSSGSSSSSNTSSGTSSNSSSSTPAPATVPYENVAISTGAVNDITGTAAATAEKNPFGTKIENNDNLTTLLSLTPEEVAQGVNVWLDIQDMSATVPQADKDLVQSASNDFTVGMYLDINLFKKVGGNAATKITETNGTVKASILIPESLWKAGRNFEIIRVHDGVPTVISGTYDENTHVFTFETDKFSTYALAYNDSAVAGSTSNSTQSSAPRTGDNNHLGVWYLLLAVSLGGLGYLGYTKKKRVNK